VSHYHSVGMEWPKEDDDGSKNKNKNKDHQRTRRRNQLTKALKSLNYGDGESSIDIELLSSEPKTGSSIIYGVLRFDKNAESEHDAFDRFQAKKEEISAIIEREWAVSNLTDVDISMVSGLSRSEKIRLILENMEGLGTEREIMDQWLEELNSKKRSSIAMDTGIQGGTQMSTLVAKQKGFDGAWRTSSNCLFDSKYHVFCSFCVITSLCHLVCFMVSLSLSEWSIPISIIMKRHIMSGLQPVIFAMCYCCDITHTL